MSGWTRLPTVWALIAWLVGCKASEVPHEKSSRDRDHNRPALFSEISLPQQGQTQSPDSSRSYFFPRIMAAGGGFLDFDRDGRLDIVWLQPRVDDSAESTPSTGIVCESTCRILHQVDGGGFEDLSEALGLGPFPGYAMGAAVGDVNNDGYSDLYITQYGPDRLLLNVAGRGFRDVTGESAIVNLRWGASACFVDFDRDGWLDLYVTNYVDYFPDKACVAANGSQDFCGPQVFAGTTDVLFHNVTAPTTPGGDETLPLFEDVSLPSGIAERQGPGLGVAAADFNGDAWPDLFVANDGAANFLWINRQDGTFRDEAILRGCAYDALGRPRAGMGIALGDVDASGTLDVFVTHLSGEANGLFLRDANGSFHDGAHEAGLAELGFPHTGFGAALADLDHDGDLDLVTVNGRVKRPEPASIDAERVSDPPSDSDFWKPYAELNQVFFNDGLSRFTPARPAGEPFCTDSGVSRALSLGDIDNDGDLDLLVTDAHAPPRIYRNDVPKRGSWVKVRAVEPLHGGRDAYGAEVIVDGAGGERRGVLAPCGSYLSAHETAVHFGLGSVRDVREIEVRWPDGTRERFAGGAVDREYVLKHGEGRTP